MGTIILNGTMAEIQRDLQRLPHQEAQRFRVVVEEATTEVPSTNGNGTNLPKTEPRYPDLEEIARQMRNDTVNVTVENGILTFGSTDPDFVLTLEMLKQIEDELDEEEIREYLAIGR